MLLRQASAGPVAGVEARHATTADCERNRSLPAAVSDRAKVRRCAWITARSNSSVATLTTATQLGRFGMLGSAKARGRDGRDGSYSRSLISALSSRPGAPLSLTTLTSEPRTMREWRHSPRDVELDRLARLDLIALLDLEEAERKQSYSCGCITWPAASHGRRKAQARKRY